MERTGLFAVVADGFDRAPLHRLFAEGFLFRAFRLFAHVGMAALFAACKVGGSGFATQVAIDALVIDIESTGDVDGVFI